MQDKYTSFLRSIFGEDEKPSFDIPEKDPTDFKLFKDPKTNIIHSPANEAYPSTNPFDKSGQPVDPLTKPVINPKDEFIKTVNGSDEVITNVDKPGQKDIENLMNFLDAHETDLPDVLSEFIYSGDDIPKEVFDKYPEAQDIADSIKQDMQDEANGRPKQLRPRKFKPKDFKPPLFKSKLISGPGRNLENFLNGN